MSPRILPTRKNLSKGGLLKFLVIFFTVLLPLVLLIFGAWSFYLTSLKETKEEELVWSKEGQITPSQLLEDRARYQNQKVILVGRIDQAPVTCEKKECPPEDECCGCPEKRSLVMADPEKILLKESVWRLRLLGPGALPLCERLPGSCDYQCPGWEMEGVYQVEGTFFAEPPPQGTGWRMYFDFYLEVKEKEIIQESGYLDKPKRFFKGLQEIIKNFQNSGYFVLQ